MTKRRILFIYKYCNMGGVASVLKQRFLHMRDEYDFDGAFFFDAGTGSQEWARHGIRPVMLGKNFAQPLEQLLAETTYDNVTVIDTPEVMPVLKKHYPGKIIFEVHTSYLDTIAQEKKAIKESDHVVVPSEWLKSVLSKRFQCESERIDVVANIVDERLFKPLDPSIKSKKPTLLWVGKLDEMKNWRDAIAIFELVKREVPAAVLQLVTGGNQTPQVQQEFLAELNRRDLVGDVMHLHHLPYGDMPRLYGEVANGGGVLLSTSLHESFSMILHEAWRCKLPAVMANVGPIGDMVTPGKDGELFAPWDVKDAARKTVALLRDPAKHEAMSEAGLATVAGYNAELILPPYLDLLDETAHDWNVPISMMY